MALYNGTIGVWGDSQMMWDLFQTRIKCKKLSLHSFQNPSCVRMLMHACTCHKQAYTWLECGHAYACMCAQCFLRHFFSKNSFILPKNKFYFPQILSSSKFSSYQALNQRWALECFHYWGTRARVVRGTKCNIYRCLLF